MKDKIERLKVVLSKINAGYGRESSFDSLYEILLSEYQKEGGVNRKTPYWNNLRQTIEKQAEDYLLKKKRRPVRGAPDEYESFVRNFKHDVTDEISRLEYENSSKT